MEGPTATPISGDFVREAHGITQSGIGEVCGAYHLYGRVSLLRTLQAVLLANAGFLAAIAAKETRARMHNLLCWATGRGEPERCTPLWGERKEAPGLSAATMETFKLAKELREEAARERATTIQHLPSGGTLMAWSSPLPGTLPGTVLGPLTGGVLNCAAPSTAPASPPTPPPTTIAVPLREEPRHLPPRPEPLQGVEVKQLKELKCTAPGAAPSTLDQATAAEFPELEKMDRTKLKEPDWPMNKPLLA